MSLEPGTQAPDFTVPAVTREGVQDLRLSDLRGQKVVLYFYPKDETPGCTKQACSFRDLSKDFEAKGAAILGVSADSVKAHQRFAKNHALPFPLLADEDKKVVEDYGVWKEKSMMGRKYMGIERTTFLIDSDGVVRRVYPKVKVDGHVKEVLEALDSI
jgi:thioredoxin-dependent peroxiredoxin